MNMAIKQLFPLSALSLVFLLGTVPAQAASLPDFTTLVEKYGPAVINVSTTQKINHPSMNRGEGEGQGGDLFRHFFGEEENAPEQLDPRSLGSGFIISKDGYIMTNYHVVREADEVIVRLSDRREIVAELVGFDEPSDLALLKVNESNLPVVKIGDSEKLKVGEWVLAIGSPFGFEYSVTAGIVSAKGRSLPRENYVPFIQTDVAINPGNSGGPLFDLDGNVVGINSQIYSRTGGFMGLSFAIPIDMAMLVVEQLKEKGRVSRGWMGILIQDVTRELAESFHMKTPKGALVAKVLPDSPAEKAGIKVGDIVLKFNGREVVNSSNLPPMVGISPIGKDQLVNMLRDGKEMTVKIRIEELREEETKISQNREPAKPDLGDDVLQMTVVDLTKDQRKQMDLKEKGVLVKEIGKGPAYQSGVRQGDVILMLDNQEVRSRKQYVELVKGLSAGKSVPMLVQRRGGPVFLALKIPK